MRKKRKPRPSLYVNPPFHLLDFEFLTPSRADCERKLHHYAGKNKWKQVCKDVAQWRGLKMVCVIVSLCDRVILLIY